jgi:hypothetical protein
MTVSSIIVIHFIKVHGAILAGDTHHLTGYHHAVYYICTSSLTRVSKQESQSHFRIRPQ